MDSTAGEPENGITSDDLGLASASGNAAATEIAMLYNGMAHFGKIQKTEYEAKGYDAGGVLPDSSAKKLYNGITVFYACKQI